MSDAGVEAGEGSGAMGCRTKIVCTIGPASASEDRLRQLVEAGMDVARLNFSHGTPEEHGETLARLRRIADSLERPVAALQDLAGSKLRIGSFREEPVHLQGGTTFTLTEEEVAGDADRVSLSRRGLAAAVSPGDRLLLGDGAIELEVERAGGGEIRCRVITGGELRSNKGVNHPFRTPEGGFLTDKDREDLRFGVEAGFDLVALSYVRSGEDVLLARRLAREAGRDVPLVAKIETKGALDRIDGILEGADAIMIARGDLGVETPLEQIPRIQKTLIRRVNRAAKPVITATQMLRSMVEDARPTRAEVTDVANAVLDGTDAVMLSEETAVGKHPVEAVRMMRRIAGAAERDGPGAASLPAGGTEPQAEEDAVDAVCRAASALAREARAAALVIRASPERAARLLARRRPGQPILAVASEDAACRRLSLLWGTLPLKAGEPLDEGEGWIRAAGRAALRSGRVKPGERLVVVSPPGEGAAAARGRIDLIEAPESAPGS